jgi:hypothetical protein
MHFFASIRPLNSIHKKAPLCEAVLCMVPRGGLICQEQIWTARSWAKPEHMDVRVYRTVVLLQDKVESKGALNYGKQMVPRGGLICQEQIWTAKSWAKPEHMDVRVYRTVVLLQDKVESKGALNYGKQMVPRGGIEPPTRGFSVLCSTD